MSTRIIQRNRTRIRRIVVRDTVRDLCAMGGDVPPGVKEISRELASRYPSIFGGWPSLNQTVGQDLSYLAATGRVRRLTYPGLGNIYEVVA